MALSHRRRMLGFLAGCSRRSARKVARFYVSGRGATLVEFALIAPLFLGLLIAILETTLYLFAQATLQNAADQAGRLFMTGQVQNNNWTATDVQNQVCPPVMFTCSNLIVVAQTYASYAAANTSAPQLYNNGQKVTSFAFNPGNPGDVMVVQLVYQWPIVGGPLGFMLPNLGDNTTELMGVTAFRVEPYGS